MNHISGLFLALLGFALMLGPLVFLHEMGHYLAARWFGVKATVFSIGFGNEVAGWTDRRGTRWRLSAVPLGGYVRFAGDMNPASLTDPAWLSLSPEERAGTFPGRPWWQRAIIVLGGPVANFIVAAIIFSGFALLSGDDRPIVGTVMPNSAAATAGLQSGDRITALDDQPVAAFADMVKYIQRHAGEKMVVHFERDGSLMAREARLGTIEGVTAEGEHYTLGQLGVGRAPLPLWRAPIAGVEATFGVVAGQFIGLGQIITGQHSVKELGGPLRIAQVSGQGLEAGWIPFLWLMGMISASLGVINILPIPMLDGGHLLFYAIEGVRQRPVGPRAMEWAFGGGLMAMLLLVLVVTYNDLDAFGLWRSLAGLIG